MRRPPPISGSAPCGHSPSSSSVRSSSSPVSASLLSASDKLSIRVEDVSVTYRTSFERAPTLRSTVLRLGRRERVVREIEALKNVSFDVSHGTVLGILGANGAGQMPLLGPVAGRPAP